MFAFSAHAFQFGTGMAPGMQCPYPYGPSNAAYSGDDEIRNLTGSLANAERKLERQEQKLKDLNQQISDARAKIQRVIKSSTAIADIERHYKYKANPEDYSEVCGRREREERTASAGGPGANIVHRPSRGAPLGGEEDPGRYAVPSDFCRGGINDWKYVVAEGGMVTDNICDYEIPLSSRRPAEERSEDCRQGLAEFYAKQAKREALEAEVRRLRESINAYNDDKERISDQIAEGTYNPYCNCQRRGQNNMGTGNFAMNSIAILGALFNRQPQRQPVLVAVPRRGPPVMPYGGYPGQSQVTPFPGQQAYPGRPYAAPIPGYAGVQPGYGPGNGVYGAAPGAIGQGAFGCQGTSPYSFGNPLAANFDPFNNSQANPFANPYANDPFSPYGQNQNAFGQNPLLNPGYGPGIQPIVGNGIPGYNQGIPGVQPFPGQQNGLAVMPWPGQNQFGNQFGAPGVMPFNGNNAFGAYPYGGPGVMPWPGQNYAPGYGNPNYGLGAPGVLPFQGNPGYGSPVYSSPIYNAPIYSAPIYSTYQNYGYQMNQLRRSITAIGGGQYGGGAPPVLPYVGSPGNGNGVTPVRTPVNSAPGVVPAR